MKVKELIEILSGFTPEADVYFDCVNERCGDLAWTTAYRDFRFNETDGELRIEADWREDGTETGKDKGAKYFYGNIGLEL